MVNYYINTMIVLRDKTYLVPEERLYTKKLGLVGKVKKIALDSENQWLKNLPLKGQIEAQGTGRKVGAALTVAPVPFTAPIGGTIIAANEGAKTVARNLPKKGQKWGNRFTQGLRDAQAAAHKRKRKNYQRTYYKYQNSGANITEPIEGIQKEIVASFVEPYRFYKSRYYYD